MAWASAGESARMFSGESDATRPTLTDVESFGVAASRHPPNPRTQARKMATPAARGIFVDIGPRFRSAAPVAANRKMQKLMPQMPATEAICKMGRKFICEYPRLPKVPCTDSVATTYSTVTQKAGVTRAACQIFPRTTALRNSRTVVANRQALSNRINATTHADSIERE